MSSRLALGLAMLWPIGWGRKWLFDVKRDFVQKKPSWASSIAHEKYMPQKEAERHLEQHYLSHHSLKQNEPTQLHLDQLHCRQLGFSRDTKLQDGLFCSTIMAIVNTYTHDLELVVLPLASPAHPRNEEGQGAEDISQMRFSSLKRKRNPHPETSTYISLARTVPHATLNKRECRQLGIFNSAHCCTKPNQDSFGTWPYFSAHLAQIP